MNSKAVREGGYGCLSVEALSEGIFRIRLLRHRRQRESMLTRYGIFKSDLGYEDGVVSEDGLSVTAGSVSARMEGDAVLFHGLEYALRLDLSRTMGEAHEEEGFTVDIPLAREDRLFGLGDESREAVMKRGRICDLWQTNVKCYGPIPYVMSARGWALAVNCTYRQTYDLGATREDVMQIHADKGTLDVYVFLAGNMRGALSLYTAVSGRPLMLPKAAYGLTFVCNEEEGARDVLENCLNFRREKIPCDIIGLEPGWMSEHYDFSVDKKWSQERFYLPYWLPENYSGSWSFFYNLRQMGFLLSLWLCCDYDLFWEEEKISREEEARRAEKAQIEDPHFDHSISMDKVTKMGEPWFEHLKKFVDNGAAAFKLDGANQIIEHRDRLYAGKYLDDEVHNVYPVVYGKQMMQGYVNHTGKRALIYTAGIYAGTQQYCASWAGDTGGDHRTMISIMNYAMSGHANTTCDLDVTSLTGIHYAMLMPWVQHLGWRNWQHPWFLGDELEGIYRDYAQLRSQLFPYLYATAHQAAQTGMPIARPLSLVYDDQPVFDTVLNEFMLGDSLLVSAFDNHLLLPEGEWTDFFTGDVYSGSVVYDPPKGKGGALLVRPGGIVVTQDWMPHLTHHDPNRYYVHIYPGAAGDFTLCEDDGSTYGYQQGEVATTRITLTPGSGGYSLGVNARRGTFEGMASLCPLEVVLHRFDGIGGVTLGGVPIPLTLKEETAVFEIPASLRTEDQTYQLNMA